MPNHGMERLRPRFPALPVDAPYHNHIHVVGRYIHVGSFRDFRQFLLDKRGYSDGRLRIDDRADDGLPATVQDSFPISHTQHPVGFGCCLYCMRLCMVCQYLPLVVLMSFISGFFRILSTFVCWSNLQLRITPNRDFAVFFPFFFTFIQRYPLRRCAADGGEMLRAIL